MENKSLPRYVIINTTDRPAPRMVCELVNGKYYYMARYMEKGLRGYALDAQPGTTPIEDFGFTVTRREFQTDFTRVSDSKAKYRDGSIREWQSHESHFSMPNVQLDEGDE